MVFKDTQLSSLLRDVRKGGGGLEGTYSEEGELGNLYNIFEFFTNTASNLGTATENVLL
jgi:hypothetical protein